LIDHFIYFAGATARALSSLERFPACSRRLLACSAAQYDARESSHFPLFWYIHFAGLPLRGMHVVASQVALSLPRNYKQTSREKKMQIS
jgi:hypothetical protein